ncbi:lysophospholipid acyltransferase family protein [Treponema sp.]|jgi:1-acyl-sn-glycerol-3-phosphate acyltransferase|uniref:lysophospholipid acyltransferase family protein n=1 Tax=Treponema sp. TaxID=166 RepID=UPI00257FE5E9|nr:lysophospholipid acyltransferase family protein [Treponema sp.]MBE6353736.1 1-acyl-sn-glycerol-3-phosphate acyltransferase [Treponema sp.]
MEQIEKDKGRLEVLARIEEFEKAGRFNEDVEQDPPTIPLTPDKVDYLGKKLSSKIKTRIVNAIALHFINKMIKQGWLVIKEVRGIENFRKIKNGGAVLTCNHFNAFDNFAVLKALEYELKHRIMYKVIREGNFTSFPGLYGLMFRNCNTLPLSQNKSTMRKFLESVDILLKRGEKILVYAEQGMWWNYRKPRPLTNGAFHFAVKNNVPVVPIFITMTDSDRIGPDGFPVQEYTIHIGEAIFADSSKSAKDNVELMKQKNYDVWKKVYEDFYGMPLSYEK